MVKFHIVKRERSEPAQIIKTFYDRDEALGYMEDYVREIMTKKNGEDSAKLVKMFLKEKQYYYQNPEYVSDASRAKVYHKFPLLDVNRPHGRESSEWNTVPLDSYFVVRSHEDLFRLSVYHKKEIRGIFGLRSGWTTTKLFDIEVVSDNRGDDDRMPEGVFDFDDHWSGVYGVFYDGKDIEDAMDILSSEAKDELIAALTRSDKFKALQTPERGFEPREETTDEEEVKEEEVDESETNPYYKKDN